jgi:enoyl-[acyl-carrier protein] reductase III
MHNTLQGKVALITGGARGIGRAVAKKFAASGCDLIINYFNSSDLAEKLCDELTTDYGVKALAFQGNVSDPSSVEDLFKQITQHFGHLDILINNAASGVLKPALNMSLKHWRWCMEINALALVLVSQQAKNMLRPGGRIIALSSLGSQRAIPNYAFIGASKAALESLVRSLSIELAPQEISVNTVSAGAVDTDALKHFPNRAEVLQKALDVSLAGRHINPDDVANVVYLLCLPEAAMIKGQTVYVDAGYSIIG